MESGTEQTIAPWWQRYILATIILVFSFIGIIIIAYLAIFSDKGDNAMQILNITLPVFASWVGTILAFYFGRENFESANKQIREIITKMTPEELASKPVCEIMRKIGDIVYLEIKKGTTEDKTKISEITALFNDKVSRVPVVNEEDKSPRYMIHESSIDKYLSEDKSRSENDSLAQFIENRRQTGLEFGPDNGFVVVSEKACIAEAKTKMEARQLCQDIFITKSGSPTESLQGWISNVRLIKYLQE